MCQERGFYEPFWNTGDDRFDEDISIFEAQHGFRKYYKIGKYRFNDFDKAEVLQDMARYERELKKLRKQLKLIEELENE